MNNGTDREFNIEDRRKDASCNLIKSGSHSNVKRADKKHKKKNRKKRKTAHRKRNIALILFCALIAIAALFTAAFFVMRTTGKNRLQNTALSSAPNLVSEETEVTAEQKTTWQEGWIRYQGKIYAYNEDILTFLIMGIDKNSDAVKVKEGVKGGQADTLLLTVLNPHTKTVNVIALNRNAMTYIDAYDKNGNFLATAKGQLALAHGFGDGVEKSCENQVKAVSGLMYDLPIHGYAAINMKGVATINDAVGGVDVTVLEDLTKVNRTWTEGAQIHLEGQDAFDYVHYRDTKQFGTADKRLARQKQYLTAFIANAKQTLKKDISSAVRLYEAITPVMTTNITVDEVTYLVPMAADYQFDMEGIRTLQGETVMGERFEEFNVDEAALYQLIIDIFYEEVKE